MKRETLTSVQSIIGIINISVVDGFVSKRVLKQLYDEFGALVLVFLIFSTSF